MHITKEKIFHIDTRQNVFIASMVLIGLCAVAYIYCVTATVRNIVEKKNLTAQAQNIGAKISAKEFTYISMQNTLTMDYARSLGFAEATEKVFITPTNVSFVSGGKGRI